MRDLWVAGRRALARRPANGNTECRAPSRRPAIENTECRAPSRRPANANTECCAPSRRRANGNTYTGPMNVDNLSHTHFIRELS